MSEKHEYRKRFYDLEKEESWLNQMCASGLVLKKIEWGVIVDKYVFEPCTKKYVCRIDYNPEMEVLDEITSPYTMFVTGTYEAEFICCANGKLYFRKAEEKGDFPPIYTSLESRIAAEKKQILRNIPVFIIMLLYGLFIGFMILGEDYETITLGTICFFTSFILLLSISVIFFKHMFKIRELKKLSASGYFPPEKTYEKISLDEVKNRFRNSVIFVVTWLICMLISAYKKIYLHNEQSDLAADIALIAVQGFFMIFHFVSALRFRKKIKTLEKELDEKKGE